MIAAAPPLPSDDPSVLTAILAIVLVLVVCFFGYWSLGGMKHFIPPEKIHRYRDVLVPTGWIVLAMLVATGLFLGAIWLEDRGREAAQDRYDEWSQQQWLEEQQSPEPTPTATPSENP